MPTYEYTARDRNGQILTGSMEAATERDVATALRNQDLYITNIKTPGTGLSADIKLPAWLDVGSKPGVRDVTLFSRQFATVINAGLPVVQSLAILQKQADKQGMKDALKNIRQDVETGLPLSDALAKHPSIFNRLYIYLARAGEASGNLDGILERIASYQEKQAELRGKIKGALTYPVVVLVIALGVTWFLLTGIVPQFASILESLGGDMPPLTQILISISAFLTNQWYVLVALIGGTAFGITSYYRTEKGRITIDRLLLTLPVFGPLIQKTAIASFSSTFGLLLRSGVNVIEAVEITKGTAGNAIIENVLDETKNAVQRGEQISTTLAKHPTAFPPLVSSMIAIGEETGAVDDLLDKIAMYYEREVDEAVGALTAALEPMMIVFLGTIVGFIVAGMFLPMFGIIGELSN